MRKQAKNRRQLTTLWLSATPILAAGAALAWTPNDTMLQWARRETATYMVLDWREGPIRRAGLGMLMRAFVQPGSVTDGWGMGVWYAALGLAVAVLATTIAILARRGARGPACLLALWCASPLGVSLLTRTSTPYDALVVAFFPILLIMLTGVAVRRPGNLVRLIIVSVLVAVMALFHESILFWAAPLVATALLIRNRTWTSALCAVLVLLPTGILVGGTTLFPASYNQVYRLYDDASFSPLPLVPRFLNGETPGIAAVAVGQMSLDRVLAYGITGLFLLPIAVATARTTQRRLLIFGPPGIGVVLLCAFATDWVRWFSSGMLLAILLGGIVAIVEGGENQNRGAGWVGTATMSRRGWGLLCLAAVALPWTVAYQTDPYQGVKPLVNFILQETNPTFPPPEYDDLHDAFDTQSMQP